MKTKQIYIVTLIIIFLFSACGKEKLDQQKPQLKGTKKLILKVHVWEGYVKPWVKKFKKHMLETKNIDVDVQITYTTGLKSFIKQINKNGVHLITPSIDLIQALYRKKLIQPINRKIITNFNQIFPQIWKIEKKFAMINQKTYAIPFLFGAYALAYDKSKMPPPTSYSVLWNPKNKDKVSITGVYGTYNIYMTALYLKLPKKDLFNLSDQQLNKVKKKLRDLCINQVYSYWEDGLRNEDYGKILVGTDWGIGISRYTKKGGNWAMTIPDEGAMIWIDNWLITKNVDSPDKMALVHEFINYSMRPESMAMAARAAECSPANIYSARYLTPEERIKFHLNEPKFFKTFVLNEPLSKKNEKRYNKIWLKAKGKK